MQNKFVINLDVNASYGLDPAVAKTLSEIVQNDPRCLLNPSSIHQGGQAARYALEVARDQIRSFLQMPRDGTVVFTAGATESNNTALFSPFWPYLNTHRSESAVVPELITTTVEHPSVYEAAKKLSGLGVKVHFVAPRSDFRFYPEDFTKVVNEKTKLVSIMAVNNETGTILPVAAIAEAVKKINPRILVHSDAVQLLGKRRITFDALSADLVSISGHKVGGLTGCGALLMAAGIGIDPLLLGGPQETRRRAGTENVLGAVSFGKAVEVIQGDFDDRIDGLSANRTILKSLLQELVPEAVCQFENLDHIGNTLSVRFPGINTADFVVALDVKGVHVSSGSACSSGKTLKSAALLGYGLSEEQASETIRISVGHHYAPGALQKAAEIIAQTAKKLTAVSVTARK